MATKSNNKKFGIEGSELDFSSTWDAPFEPTKSKEVTPKEFLKKLDPEKVVKECQHKLQRIKCPCGKDLAGKYCILCSTMFCGEQCLPQNQDDDLFEEDLIPTGSDLTSQNTEHYHDTTKTNGYLQNWETKSSSTEQDKMKEQTTNTNPNTIATDIDEKVQERKLKFQASSSTDESISSNASSNIISNSVNSNPETSHSGLSINKKLSAGRGKPLRRKVEPLSFTPSPSRLNEKLKSTEKGEEEEVKSIRQVHVPASNAPTTTTATFVNSVKNNIEKKQEEEQTDVVQTCSVNQNVTKCSNSLSIKTITEDKVKSDKKTDTNCSRNIIVEALQHFGKQPPIEETKENFLITHFAHFNRVYIMKMKIAKVDLVDLMDDINDFCLDEPELNEIPQIGDLVCAPYPYWNQMETMQRAVVLRVQDGNVDVQFIDFGTIFPIPMGKLKKFNPDFLLTPVLGYEIKLRDVPDDPVLLLQTDFEQKIQKQFTHREVKVVNIQMKEVNLYEGDILVDEKSLSKTILDLEKWDWERLYETGATTDEKLVDDEYWTKVQKPTLLVNPLKKKEIKGPINMQLSQIYPSECLLLFKNIQIDRIQREQRVMELQIKRYTDKVQTTRIFPKISEIFLLQQPDKDIWERAQRVDAYTIYCLDTGLIYDLETEGQNFRFLCQEFLKIPPAAIRCALSDFQPDSKLQKAIENFFKLENYYDVKIIKFDETQCCYKIHCEKDAFLHVYNNIE